MTAATANANGFSAIKRYDDVMRFSAEGLLGNAGETVFVGAMFIGEKSPGKVVLGAYVAPKETPDLFGQVVMAGWTTIGRAHQATIICRDLFRMRIGSDGTCLTFDQLIIALDSDDCGIHYDFIGDLADDFRSSVAMLVVAIQACRNLSLPFYEAMRMVLEKHNNSLE